MNATHRRTPLRMALAAALLSSLAGFNAHAQQFPSKPLRFVHGFPGGSATDTISKDEFKKLVVKASDNPETDPFGAFYE